jgi:DNA-directed RNA polymerase specialized sigma24 family protein
MVAESLGCSIGTVKTHASRGLAALRVALGADEEAMS